MFRLFKIICCVILCICLFIPNGLIAFADSSWNFNGDSSNGAAGAAGGTNSNHYVSCGYGVRVSYYDSQDVKKIKASFAAGELPLDKLAGSYYNKDKERACR